MYRTINEIRNNEQKQIGGVTFPGAETTERRIPDGEILSYRI